MDLTSAKSTAGTTDSHYDALMLGHITHSEMVYWVLGEVDLVSNDSRPFIYEHMSLYKLHLPLLIFYCLVYLHYKHVSVYIKPNNTDDIYMVHVNT